MTIDVLYGPFPREAGKRINETGVVRRLFASGCLSTQGEVPVMVDVGACFGKAFAGFAEQGWRIYAFEPNPPVFSKLVATRSGPDVTVSPLAVSDVDGADMPFYTSQESIAISSLKPFLQTHKPTAKVETVRLDTFIRENGIKTIDFLKIDTEGFDLLVLKGLSMDENRPSVVVCEFEDAKTVPLGYDTGTLAGHLQAFGYSVYVSEWHPIILYGGKTHRWRSFQRWSQGLIEPRAWGNLIAFKYPFSENDLVAAVREEVKAATLRAGDLGSRLKARSLALFRIQQLIVGVVRAIRRHPLIPAAGIIALAVFAVAPVFPPLWPHRLLLWGLGGLIALVGMAGLFAALAYEVVRMLLNAQETALRAHIESINVRSEDASRKLSAVTRRLAEVEEVSSLLEEKYAGMNCDLTAKHGQVSK